MARTDKEKERRKALADLPFAEKLRLLGKLRKRSLAIAGSGLRKKRQETKTRD